MNETIRDYIKRRVRWWFAAAVLAWFAMPLTASLWKGPGKRPLLLFGMALFLGAILGLQLFVRCPKCAARLGRTIALPVGFGLGSRRQVNFCPYCGVNLDAPRPQLTSPIS